MKVIFFSSQKYDKLFFSDADQDTNFRFEFFESRLDVNTARLASGADAVCVFVNDCLNGEVLSVLAEQGVKMVALRCAGFNNVDLEAAESLGIPVVRVPAYSPHAVAEHTIALLLALNRNLHRAHNRVREGNFALDGLMGFDIYGLTVGVVGTGNIGINVARILKGFGCEVLALDPFRSDEAIADGLKYVSFDELLRRSQIITLHCPLSPETHHMIDADAIEKMSDGVMLLNTSRGGLIDTKAVIEGLKSGKIAHLGIDVYEEEGDLFFEDLSNDFIQDDVFARLITFPNVLITGHQAFLTREAIGNIADTTLNNITEYLEHGRLVNSVVSSNKT